MDYVISGLPMHVLLVHGTVVFVPLAALCTVLSIVWPAARRRLGIVTPLIALVALVLVPITQQAGAWLMQRVDSRPRHHRAHPAGRHTAALGHRRVHRGHGAVAVVPVRDHAGGRAAEEARNRGFPHCGGDRRRAGSCPVRRNGLHRGGDRGSRIPGRLGGLLYRSSPRIEWPCRGFPAGLFLPMVEPWEH